MIRVLASTTSHKREPLLPTLEIFAKLGLRDIDLNLHHLLELNTSVRDVVPASRANRIHASGRWCDFFHAARWLAIRSLVALRSVCGELGVSQLRLFFGRLSLDAYTPAMRATASTNLTRLADAHPAMLFVFENHDGASLNPQVCAEILSSVDRPNIRMNFDPINFERHGVDSNLALEAVLHSVAHVARRTRGRRILRVRRRRRQAVPMLRTLSRYGFDGAFSVEHEGRHDGTLRLYQSVERARAAWR
jgi:sugar phosphate isomerase/epimerase